MHQPPNVPNYGRPGRGPKLERGLALAVEPMVTLGSKYTELDEDEWTVVTDDGSWAAHFEHTFTLTPDGAWVLTALDGGRAMLAELGVPYGGGRDPMTARSCCSRSGAKQAAADNEYESFLRFTGLPEAELPRVNLARARAATDRPRRAGPGSCSAAARGTPATPGAASRRRRSGRGGDHRACSTTSSARDFPFLGACYGIGTLGLHQGGRGRPQLARAGRSAVGDADRRGRGRPALRGRAAATSRRTAGTRRRWSPLPAGAVQLATSAACPVQAFRVGRNVYATQFHPELDLEGVCTRIEVYKNAGYFPPSEAETLKERSRAVEVQPPDDLLANFVAVRTAPLSCAINAWHTIHVD